MKNGILSNPYLQIAGWLVIMLFGHFIFEWSAVYVIINYWYYKFTFALAILLFEARKKNQPLQEAMADGVMMFVFYGVFSFFTLMSVYWASTVDGFKFFDVIGQVFYEFFTGGILGVILVTGMNFLSAFFRVRSEQTDNKSIFSLSQKFVIEISLSIGAVVFVGLFLKSGAIYNLTVVFFLTVIALAAKEFFWINYINKYNTKK